MVSKWTSFIAVEEREEGEYDDPAALDLSLQVHLVVGLVCECLVFAAATQPFSRLRKASQSLGHTHVIFYTGIILLTAERAPNSL